MKNSITQVSLFVIAVVALSLLMSYTRPAPEEPKQYILIKCLGSTPASTEKFEQDVNEKLATGWHPQGGVSYANYGAAQAMVK